MEKNNFAQDTTRNSFLHYVVSKNCNSIQQDSETDQIFNESRVEQRKF